MCNAVMNKTGGPFSCFTEHTQVFGISPGSDGSGGGGGGDGGGGGGMIQSYSISLLFCFLIVLRGLIPTLFSMNNFSFDPGMNLK